jgi:hypothetical protein
MGLSLVKELSGSVMWGPKMKELEPFDYTNEELDALLKRAKDQIEDKDYRILEAMVESLKEIKDSVHQDKIPGRQQLQEMLSVFLKGSKKGK